MPPPSRNQWVPTADDKPAAAAASSLDSPRAIASQNQCRCSRRQPGGRPGECIGGRSARSAGRRVLAPIATLPLEMLRRPFESAQYLSIRYTERLAEEGAVTSVGSRGDSYDNAMAESIIGLYKSELIYNERYGPWRTVEDVELATLAWVHWWNTTRLHSAIGDVPPTELEADWLRARENQPTGSPQSDDLDEGGINTPGETM